ncbi:MAG: hypothetical protein ACOXZ5_09565 [Syntrophomonadaceae bacterium]|jgi:cell division protein FtsL
MVQAGYDYAWEAEPVKKTRIVRKTYRSVDQKKVFLIKVGILAFIYAVLLVYLCIKGAVLGYQIVTLENDIKSLEAANGRLEYQIAEKYSLDRVEQIAVQQLGMYKAETHVAIAQENVTPVHPVGTDHPVIAAQDSNQKPLEKLYAGLVVLAARNN